MDPRETANNAYAKFWGDKQRALWYVMVFSGVVNCCHAAQKTRNQYVLKIPAEAGCSRKHRKQTIYTLSLLGVQVTGMIEGGRDKNQNPQKSLGFPTKPKKIPCRISELKNFQKLNAYSFFMIPYEDIISGHYHES